MEELKVNVPLLRKTLEHIEAHPEEHNQSEWAMRGLDTPCGTAYCLAGHAVQLAGHKIQWYDTCNIATFVKQGDGVLFSYSDHSISAVAQRELGLTSGQASTLFHGANTRSSLWFFAHQLTNGEIEIPEKYL